MDVVLNCATLLQLFKLFKTIISLNCLCNGVLENVSILCIYTTSFKMSYINKVVLKEHVRIAHSVVTYSIEVTCADIRDV